MKDLTAVTIEGEPILVLFDVLRRFELVDDVDELQQREALGERSRGSL